MSNFNDLASRQAQLRQLGRDLETLGHTAYRRVCQELDAEIREKGDGILRVNSEPPARPAWPPFSGGDSLNARNRRRAGRLATRSFPRGRILLIDDDAPFREMAGQMLRSAGHEVLEAVDGQAGVDCYCLGESIDLVLTDMLMPRLGGLETIRVLRLVNPLVKIIATSGAGHLDLAVQCGARRMLPKPFTQDELLTAVGEVLAA